MVNVFFGHVSHLVSMSVVQSEILYFPVPQEAQVNYRESNFLASLAEHHLTCAATAEVPEVVGGVVGCGA